MGLAYKFYDSVIGEIVNKTKLSNKKVRNNQHPEKKYIYMTKDNGEKIKDFLDLDNQRKEQIMQDAQVLKKVYLSDEVVEKIKEEINSVFEQEYYAYTNRLHEHKQVLEQYRTYLDGIEDRIRDYEKIALQSNTELQQYSSVFTQYSEEIEAFNIELDKYESKLAEYEVARTSDKQLLENVEKMVDKNMNLDIQVSNEVHQELSKNNIKMHEYFEQEFTKIAARSIKSRRKTDAMLGLLLGTNIITILGVVAMYFFK